MNEWVVAEQSLMGKEEGASANTMCFEKEGRAGMGK
jgi:hypothetical protein